MKDKVMDALQRFSKAMFIPVLILPIAGILIAVGNLFTNPRLQAVLPFLNNPVTIGFGTLLSGSLNAILTNLGVIFCVGLSVGLANKKKSEAGFISLLRLKRLSLPLHPQRKRPSLLQKRLPHRKLPRLLLRPSRWRKTLVRMMFCRRTDYLLDAPAPAVA